MSTELCVKVNEPVNLKILLDEIRSLLEQIGVSDQPQLLVKQDESFLTERELKELVINKSCLEAVIEIPSHARVFMLVFNAGNSQWLGEEGGFWTYFEAGSTPCPSFVLMIILAIAYSKLTKSDITDDALLLGEDRFALADNILNQIRANDTQNFVNYSAQICQQFKF